ncbi:hypothetical protein CsSME_00050525 [Camellia sinensis var. sinensis]
MELKRINKTTLLRWNCNKWVEGGGERPVTPDIPTQPVVKVAWVYFENMLENEVRIREGITPGSKSSISRHKIKWIATNNGHGENSPYFDGWKAYDSNPYHPTQNPNGVIQMGLAENEDYHGLPEFRKGVAKFMGKVRGDKGTFDPDRIVMSGGATGAHEMLAFCFADPGEAFLVPTPYYAG